MATKKRVTRAPSSDEVGENGRGNGGEGENNGAITGASPISKRTPGGGESEDIGNREAIPAAALDKVYTAESKEKWGDDQPSLADQLKHKQDNDATAAQVEAGEVKQAPFARDQKDDE